MAGDEKVRRYRAFIAYSHRDKRWAAWLHRRLEFYRVPHRLVGRETAAGLIERRLTPIFRDREELATANDLDGKITQALENSDNLIVVCSPSAARSKWVNEEIRRFRSMGRGARIFCFVVDGQPSAGGGGSEERDVLFPATLCGQGSGEQASGPGPVEPLAADVRPGQDGRGLALMKLIAGLLGVGLDELRRRELQRRNRRWAAVATLALVVMAATSLLALEATEQRSIAEHRRAQAESLVSFMLGNLRSELQPIGRLDLLDMVGKRVLSYYASQKLSSMDAGSLERRARALDMVGGVYEQRGNLDAALSAYRRAEAATAQLLAKDPDDPERIYAHAQSVFYLAAIAHERGDLAQAEAGFRRYYKLAQRLVKIDPDNSKWHSEFTYATGDLGILLLSEKKYRAAAGVLRKGVAMFSERAGKFPHDADKKLDLANMRAWFADSEEYQGHFKEARRQRLMQLAIYRKLLKADPDNSGMQYLLATCYRALANYAIDRGDLKNAEARIKAVIDVSNSLVIRDITNTDWQESNAAGWVALGEGLYARHEFSAAQKAADKAGQIARELLAKDSTVIAWQTRIMARNRLLLARLASHGGRHEDARAIASSVATTLAAMPAAKRGLVEVETTLMHARLLQGDELQALGRPGSAGAWKDVLDIARANTGSLTPDMRTSIAGAYVRLGNIGEARHIMMQLDGIGYRAPGFQSLKKRLARARTEQASTRPSRGGSHLNP